MDGHILWTQKADYMNYFEMVTNFFIRASMSA